MLDSSQLQKVVMWLKTYRPKCPVCQGANGAQRDAEMVGSTIAVGDTLPVNGPWLRLIAIMCNGCGYTETVSAKTMGVVP